jgi:phosphoglycolate phosphatase-like HAD superfamily hydrolase
MIEAKAAIFDLDGTLVDTTKRFHITLNEVLKKRGIKTLEFQEFLDHYIADTLDDAIVSPQAEKREEKLHEIWMEFLRKYRTVDVPEDRPIEGAKEALKDVSDAGVPIAVITSCIAPGAQIEEELSRYGMLEFVDAIVTGSDVAEELDKGYHFSKKEIFMRAAYELGIDIRDCVVVGDYWNDIKDARELGAKTVAVLTGLMRKNFLQKFGPDAVIESVRELQKVVKFEVL